MLTPRQKGVFVALVGEVRRTGQPVGVVPLARVLGIPQGRTKAVLDCLKERGYVGPAYRPGRNTARGYIPLKYPDWIEREAA